MKTRFSSLLVVATVFGIVSPTLAYRDLETGTFITRDPAGFVDGPNLYTYVRQNPWTFFDPEGLYGNEINQILKDFNDPYGTGEGGDEVERGMANMDREMADAGKKAASSFGKVGGEVLLSATPGLGGLRAANKVSKAATGVKPNKLKQAAKWVKAQFDRFFASKGTGTKGDPSHGAGPSGQGSEAFEITDGVRRSKASDLTGKKTINAEIRDADGNLTESREVSLDWLHSPNKSKIDVSTNEQMDRYMNLQKRAHEGKKLDPIQVTPGGRGPKIKDVEFDTKGDR